MARVLAADAAAAAAASAGAAGRERGWQGWVGAALTNLEVTQPFDLVLKLLHLALGSISLL